MIENRRPTTQPISFIGATLLAVTLAACSPAPAPAASNPPAAAGTTAPAVAPTSSTSAILTAAPATTATIRNAFTALLATVPSSLDPIPFNPADSTYGPAQANAAYSGLTRWDPSKGVDGLFNTFTDLQPELAQSVTPSADGMSVQVALRTDVKADSGDSLSAADVKYTFDRIIGSKTTAVNGLTLASIDTTNPITVVDDQHITINLSAASPTIMASLAGIPIIDSVEAQKHKTDADPWANLWLTSHTVGYGPYSAASFTPNQSVTYTASPNYWRGQAAMKTVVYKQVADPSTRAQAVLAGNADYATQINVEDVAAAKASPNYTVFGVQRPLEVQLILNEKDPKMGDPKVRDAVSLALNRDDLAAVYLGYAKPALDCIQSSLPHPEPEPLRSSTPDVAGAKSLMTQAGQDAGFSMHIAISPAATDTSVALARILQANLQAIGIGLMVDQYGTFAEFAAARDQASAYITQQTPGIPTAASYLSNFYQSKSGANLGHYVNPQMDTLIATALSGDPTNATTMAALKSACDIIVAEQPLVRLVEPANLELIDKNLLGMHHYADSMQRPYNFSWKN